MNVAVIPARSGSKGFKDKNIALINGISLIEYAVRAAKSSTSIDKIIISTDCEIYERIAIEAGAESLGLRPEELSGDKAKSVDVLVHLLSSESLSETELVILLQPTSPIRTGEDIDRCVKLASETNESVVTVSKVEEPHPFKLKRIVDGSIAPFIEGTSSEVARQRLPSAYELTGGIYVSSAEQILKKRTLFSSATKPIIVAPTVNIDRKADFDYLEYLVKRCEVRLP